MDVKGRLDKVSEHLHSIDIHSSTLYVQPFVYVMYKNAFDTPLWETDGFYQARIGSFRVKVVVEFGEYWIKLLIYNQQSVIHKQVIDLYENT